MGVREPCVRTSFSEWTFHADTIDRGADASAEHTETVKSNGYDIFQRSPPTSMFYARTAGCKTVR
jgi:hypothetical protein